MTQKTAFDFDTPIERSGTDSYKWGDRANAGAIPMWVADMDFATAPVVAEAVRRRAQHPVFGYVQIPESYWVAMQGWYKRRFGWTIDRAGVIVTTGVVPALSAVIKALVPAGGRVIVQTPAYNCFFSSIANNRCRIIENRLVRKAGRWQMDLDDLKEKLQGADLLLLCNPHNPVGRSWTVAELEAVAHLCREAGVPVLSDEIHAEFVFAPSRHTPFATLAKDIRPKTVVATSASKAFNIAALQNAIIVTEDESVRRAVDRAININEVCDVNPFGVAAMTAAWSGGDAWLDALKEYLAANDRRLREIFAEVLAGDLARFPMTPLEATYLEWIDCTALGMASDAIESELIAREHVRINAGSHYREAPGTSFIRINIACPRVRLEAGARAVAMGLKRLLAQRSNR